MDDIFNVTVKSASALTSDEIDQWRELQRADSTMMSPFFSPEYTLAIEAATQSAQVALARNKGHLIGILPFHKGPLKTGVPIGAQITDFQGIIGPLKTTENLNEFVKACGLRVYDFNHLPKSQTAFAKSTFLEIPSPYMDLSDGYEAYYAERTHKGSKKIKSIPRELRRIERDIGPLRIELNDPSDRAWQAMIKWKTEFYEYIGVKSILDKNWALDTLTLIRDIQKSSFSGMLSTAYAGDELIAVNFGMRSHNTWHGWFTTYNTQYKKYSPGLVLLLEMAKRAPDIGVIRIDLGRGDERYKQSFTSSNVIICEGSVITSPSIPGSLRYLQKHIQTGLSKTKHLDNVSQFQRRAFNKLVSKCVMPRLEN